MFEEIRDAVQRSAPTLWRDLLAGAALSAGSLGLLHLLAALSGL